MSDDFHIFVRTQYEFENVVSDDIMKVIPKSAFLLFLKFLFQQ